jgi:hypothetical protein
MVALWGVRTVDVMEHSMEYSWARLREMKLEARKVDSKAVMLADTMVHLRVDWSAALWAALLAGRTAAYLVA